MKKYVFVNRKAFFPLAFSIEDDNIHLALVSGDVMTKSQKLCPI
jgi:hypothetical protein